MDSCIPVCACNGAMENTGIGCNPFIEVAKILVFIPLQDSTGADNYLDLSNPLTQAVFTALINQSDASKRWFPLPAMLDIEDKRDAAILHKHSDDSNSYVRDGVRKFSGMIWKKGGETILKKKIESARCLPIGAFIIDRLGNLVVGSVSADKQKAYPVPVDNGSIAATLMLATDTTVVGLKVEFNYDPTYLDSCTGMIKATSMGDAQLLKLKGLKNVYAIYSELSTTNITAKLYLDSLDPTDLVPMQGLTTADFISVQTATTSKARRTNNTPADIAITVAESPTEPGTYTITPTVEATTGDTIIVSATKAGFDFKNIQSVITIP